LILVIDASVTIAWIAENEKSEYADLALHAFGSDAAIVPGIWHWEIANVLLALERKGRIVDAIGAYARVVQLPIDVELVAYSRDRRSVTELELARKHHLSVYDAAYLALAKATSRPLATLDARLERAARAESLFFDPDGKPVAQIVPVDEPKPA
jgi:predicted nucleic acid-binding protein